MKGYNGLYPSSEVISWIMQKQGYEQDNKQRKNSLKTRLSQLRIGMIQTKKNAEGKDGKPWYMEPQLIEGEHWIRIGRSIFYTEQGKHSLERIFLLTHE